MNVLELSKDRNNDWNRYIENHPKGNIYFKTSWQETIVSEFGHRPKYFLVEEHGSIIGVLPLFVVRFLGKVKLISIPYCPYGGVLYDKVEARKMLIDTMVAFSKDIGAKFIEIKEQDELYSGFENFAKYITFKLDLKQGVTFINSNLSNNTKRNLKKGLKQDYSITIDQNIDVFFDLYSKHMKHMGSPIMRKVFFIKMIEELKEKAKIATIWNNGLAAASILILESNNSVVYDRGATNYELRNLGLNYVLFWKLIEEYEEKGFDHFDFGRSVKSSGTYQFKNGWRPEIINLQYQYKIYKGTVPDFSQESWKRRLFTKLFLKLPRVEYLDFLLRKHFP